MKNANSMDPLDEIQTRMAIMSGQLDQGYYYLVSQAFQSRFAMCRRPTEQHEQIRAVSRCSSCGRSLASAGEPQRLQDRGLLLSLRCTQERCHFSSTAQNSLVLQQKQDRQKRNGLVCFPFFPKIGLPLEGVTIHQ